MSSSLTLITLLHDDIVMNELLSQPSLLLKMIFSCFTTPFILFEIFLILQKPIKYGCDA